MWKHVWNALITCESQAVTAIHCLHFIHGYSISTTQHSWQHWVRSQSTEPLSRPVSEHNWVQVSVTRIDVPCWCFIMPLFFMLMKCKKRQKSPEGTGCLPFVARSTTT